MCRTLKIRIAFEQEGVKTEDNPIDSAIDRGRLELYLEPEFRFRFKRNLNYFSKFQNGSIRTKFMIIKSGFGR